MSEKLEALPLQSALAWEQKQRALAEADLAALRASLKAEIAEIQQEAGVYLRESVAAREAVTSARLEACGTMQQLIAARLSTLLGDEDAG